MRPSPAPTSRRTAPSPSLRRWLRTPSRTSRSLSRYSFAYLGAPPNPPSSSQRAHRSCSTMLRFSPSVLTREPCHHSPLSEGEHSPLVGLHSPACAGHV